MSLKRTRGAVSDLKYHVVWVPKYRRMVFGERVASRLKMIFQEISERYGFEIDTQEVMDDHVHIFLSVPPRYSPAQVVQRLKSISASRVFKEFPELGGAVMERGVLGGWVFCSDCGCYRDGCGHTKIYSLPSA